MADRTITTQCCIAGGGPAGMMLGFLLARAGVRVIVLEKHGRHAGRNAHCAR
jgi:2-polyprenyl-6-methoxyphenol hydroxylase-like FAD-dependent oxidoreductase